MHCNNVVPANVRFGSLADISERDWDVRFTPESGHNVGFRGHPLPYSSSATIAPLSSGRFERFWQSLVAHLLPPLNPPRQDSAVFGEHLPRRGFDPLLLRSAAKATSRYRSRNGVPSCPTTMTVGWTPFTKHRLNRCWTTTPRQSTSGSKPNTVSNISLARRSSV